MVPCNEPLPLANIMSTSLTFLSAIIGTDIAFEVTLSNIQSVHDLKEQIIAENEQALGSFDATSLTLFKVKIDVSQGNFKNMMKDISRGSVFFHRQELDLPSVKLCDIFQETDLPRLSIHILIKLPAGESINSGVCSAETMLSPPQLRQSSLSLREE